MTGIEGATEVRVSHLLPIASDAIEGLDVREVLKAAGGLLVRDQVMPRQNRNLLALQVREEPIGPGCRKIDAIDGGDDVHADGWNPDLEDQSGTREIVARQVMERCPERLERLDDPRRVLGAWSHPDIEVLGRANVPMRRERMRSDDQILNAMGAECG